MNNKLTTLALCAALMTGVNTFAEQPPKPAEAAAPAKTEEIVVAIEETQAEIAPTTKTNAFVKTLLANQERRNFIRSLCKTSGSFVAKIITSTLMKSWANKAHNKWGVIGFAKNPKGPYPSGLINPWLNVGTFVDYAIPGTTGAAAALAFDSLLEKLPADQVPAVQASKKEALTLGIMTVILDSITAFIGFKESLNDANKLEGDKKLKGANEEFKVKLQFGPGGKHKAGAAIWKPLAASIALKAVKEKLYKHILEDKSALNIPLDQLQSLISFLDLDDVSVLELKNDNGSIGFKKKLNGAVGKTAAALFDGRVLNNKSGSQVKWNNFLKTVIQELTSAATVSMVDRCVTYVDDRKKD